MLTKAEIEERLRGDLADIAENISPLRLAKCERDALETAQQLAEWLQRLCAFWYLGGPLMDVPLDDVDKFYAQIQAWLEGEQ